MQLASGHHLTFCTNIFPGESWAEVRGALAEHLPRVRARLCPSGPFGVGLRLSAAAARDLKQPEAFEELVTLLEESQSYVFTVNGFPYGQFHRGAVKQKVYEPDWQTADRLAYTSDLGELLVRLSHESARTPKRLSLSTVPGSYRQAPGTNLRKQVAIQLVRQALRFHRLRQEHGVVLTLALEPEPACLFETTAECVSFLTDEIFSARARAGFTALTLKEDAGLLPDPSDLEAVLRAHLGLCIDTCHAAVQFEEPNEIWNLLGQSGVNVFKIQATTGLEAVEITPEVLTRLRRFDDGIYLHQGTLKVDGRLERFVDLAELIARAETLVTRDAELRVHFHVPVFQKELGIFQNTQAHLCALLALERAAPKTEHVEVETYTFDVLPPELRPWNLAEAICREVEWVRAELEGTPESHSP
jgi:hypothetical protein